MNAFTTLFTAIDQTTKTNDKVAAMVHYFQQAEERDIIYAIAILTGNRPKRPVKTPELKEWAAEYAGIPLWLFDESYHTVGDLAETIALILPPPLENGEFKLHEMLVELNHLLSLSSEEKRKVILYYWRSLETEQRFVFNKLITGNFRMGVSRQLVIKALAIYLQQEETAIAHRLMGKWQPDAESMDTLFGEQGTGIKFYLPYPFFLAYPLEEVPEDLGPIGDWILEKKLDGIRGQIIVRNRELFVWSRGEELLTDKFPEFTSLATVLPEGTVLDGEIIPWKEGAPLPFQVMQTRIGRKQVTKKSLADAPLTMVCYDLLEWEGKDIRSLPLEQRRALLEALFTTYSLSPVLLLSALMSFENWAQAHAFRQQARALHCEGLMLKRKDGPYEVGRKRGNWWKWKTDPMTIDGVLLYAQSGHGRRANLFTDYTFAVWEEGVLVPFAKAYSGLTDKEIVELDTWIKRNTIEKFGPVRSVPPVWVFELAFEGINKSARHKSGVALRFPRILRWRRDKAAAEANTLADLNQLIKVGNE